jgi:hypothetical protein
MSDFCRWCDVEKVPPTVTHTCDPQVVRQRALNDAAKLVATTNYYEPNETTARRIREYDGDEGTRGRHGKRS